MSLKIYLVSRPCFDIDVFLSFLYDQETSWTRSTNITAPEEIVETAGRVCYMSFGKNQSPKTNAEYIQHLIQMEHESVLEHVNWSFLLTGVSRAFTHQLVRHRVGFAFSQLSQQYHDEKDAEFIEPSQLKEFPNAQAAWQRAVKEVKESYNEILKSLEEFETKVGIGMQKRESRRAIHSIARSILPNATETKIFVTANARALRHFLKIRGSIPGDQEMRQVSAELLKYLKVEAPSIFCDFDTNLLPDGSPVIVQVDMADTSTSK
ncbi:MAG: FAD-dependent thymidylate synthase [Nostoc sp.]|uniref:FAD-dependent thymidylate synthase n=1 Tax=Nostoc sp. TaxID=1180 RepID=UPI002FF920B5